mmetsp:Transcript_34426/g.55690  ORF Transcript_34426/g.55690 Transcript_34426/m.55690 type:complete len:310 (-) Transcript_34426:543-1472(-)|eukprot:CAMPEP_0184671164 /NCGR_PEP_ID=MMETSP0308-20130426/85339_1 /TAXON_ID=38269 /ORGANISM="Gloeochaete witrockiana, Strain SAG 46.84" /LENGTH=309 /DNA_ID=CAMNT_0027118243 /DNA_START=104 /DNA_END=1033 /DNA_ORIENTATION=+
MEWVEFLPLVNLEQNVSRINPEDRRFIDQENIKKEISAMMKEDVSSLQQTARNGDPKSILKLGNRYRTGVGVPKNLKRAKELYIKAVETSEKGKAYSCLCHLFYMETTWKDITKALEYADLAAQTGYSSPVVLRMGQQLASQRRSLSQYTFLWAACDKRMEDVEREDRELVEKERKCAKEGCPIFGHHALNRCGRCRKTYYCTKEHQTADWPRHKADCQALLEWAPPASSEPSAPVAATDAAQSHFESSGGKDQRVEEDDNKEQKKEKKKKEKKFSIDYKRPDGGKTRLMTSTMDPAFLEEVSNKLHMK